MKTEILKIDKDQIDLSKIRYSADIIRNGGLVAFPTETVYGLGANAYDENAVQNIFKAKGRPSDNPLIVHVSCIEEVPGLVLDMPSNASRLMDEFWPGPLTIIMRKSERVPYIVTAGINTVGIRMPSHPVALSLIREAGVPIAAPSANSSGKPSPTNAAHVITDLSGKVDVIIDSGISNVGLESTVLDITDDNPVILRPGGITPAQIEKVLGKVSIDPAILRKADANFKPKAPGMKYTHYSPKADVIVVDGQPEKAAAKINELWEDYKLNNIFAGILATDQTIDLYGDKCVISAGDRERPETIANSLFRLLRKFDEIGVRVILAEAIDNSGIGLAVMNRLNKAAGYNIIKVE
ncbi:MAG: L-threonylcarbamoyladenylate synthase [Bacillota bacterium]|nr:L-threonylcarbamoyladenylate synthase [Bacillota bacterium]